MESANEGIGSLPSRHDQKNLHGKHAKLSPTDKGAKKPGPVQIEYKRAVFAV
jgi:hypothetical protein